MASANIVGYNTVTVKPGYNMLALIFENVGESAAISIQDLIPGNTAGLTGGANAANADMIQIYDAVDGSYTDYFLYNNPRQPTNTKNFKWCSTVSGAPLAEKDFKSGDSFWFFKQGTTDVTITIAGQVSTVASQTIEIKPGFNMIGNAFPANFNPNAFGQDVWKTLMANGAIGGANAANADMIQVYDAATGNYTDYFLYNNPRQTTNAKNGKWVSTASGAPEIDASAEVVSVGKGAWYYHKGTGFTLTIANPTK